MSDGGFLAMMDALLFITVIIVACSIVVGTGSDDPDERSDASELLESLMSSKMRLSDVSEGDDSMVRLSDLMALHALRGSEPVSGYICEVLDAFTGGSSYLLTIEYTDPAGNVHRAGIGTAAEYRESAERTAPMSTGGTVRAVLGILKGRCCNDSRT